jgi:uncharacterized protein
MIIDLSELKKKKVPLHVKADFGEEPLKLRSPLAWLVTPAHSQLRVVLSGERLAVDGRVVVDLEVACCRCAKGFPQHVEKTFSVEYWPDPKVVHEGEELELSYDELDIGFYRGDKFDLSAVVTEQILLDIPMKPVCRESCKGLCDQCGADLNEETCECARTRVDPRLEVLAQIKNKMIN